MPTLLVANRGEIALRVFRTAKRMGMRCVAVYSDADAEAPFVREADEAIRIGPPAASDSYLNIERILDAAKLSNADLVHPGYGFLAESDQFALACEEAELKFVGPTSDVLRQLGSKDQAKAIAIGAGVPVVEGYSGADQSDESFASAAAEIGYPVMIKPAEGGGGKGMAVANSSSDLKPALAAARRVALAAFGDERLLIERYLTGARHVEVQIMGDSHGNLVHFGERDCSLQRRHQKIIEESPSPAITDETRNLLCESALRLGQEVGYRNAGTCEFIVGDDGTVSFLEVNARLQVEHPVTEMVTGRDLVELQLLVGLGERLPVTQNDIRFDGHAFEARIYAEDPDEESLPQSGRIHSILWPAGARVETGVEAESVVSTYYDPMIAKVIVHAGNRAAALDELSSALSDTSILGLRTNLGFLQTVIEHPSFKAGEITTTWLETGYQQPVLREEPPPEEVLALAAAHEIAFRSSKASDPWQVLGPFRLGAPRRAPVLLTSGNEEIEVTVEVKGNSKFLVEGKEVSIENERGEISGRGAFLTRSSDRPNDPEATIFVLWDRAHYEIGVGPLERRPEEGGRAHLDAPMPGQVIAVKVSAGETVKRGQGLVVVEAMKMEHTIKAPADGVIEAVFCAPGDQVDRGQTLVEFEPL